MKNKKLKNNTTNVIQLWSFIILKIVGFCTFGLFFFMCAITDTVYFWILISSLLCFLISEFINPYGGDSVGQEGIFLK